MGSNIRLALIGCGRIANKHFEVIGKLEEEKRVSLEAICDIDPDALDQAKSRANAKAFYTDIQTMLSEIQCDCVVLCTPSGLHPGQIELCARAGFNVLSEKPLGTNWVQARSAVETCRQQGVELFISHQNRFNATAIKMKKLIASGQMGKINFIQSNVFWTRPQVYYDAASWRGTKSLDGGALMNQASHYVDMVSWLMDSPIDWVFANGLTQVRQIECEDSIVVTIRWKNGAIGSLNITMLTYPSNKEGSVTVLADLGSIKMGGVAMNQFEYSELAPGVDMDLLSNNYQVDSVYGLGHEPLYREMINALTADSSNAVSGQDSLKSLEIICAAYLSMETHMPVKLPLSL